MVQRSVVVAAGVGLLAVAVAAYLAGGAARGATLAACVPIGALGGLALYHATFGFTGAWRRLQRERRGAGVRAQLLLLGVVAATAYPLIASGVFGQGWVFPMSVASAIGAAMFGFGMQLGGGCGSGTLFTVGGGSTRMALTLLFFVLGSVLWVATNGAFQDGLDAVSRVVGFEAAPVVTRGRSFISDWGAAPALLSALLVLAALWAASRLVEKRAHGAVEKRAASDWSMRGFLRGPWTKTQGAVALAAASILTLIALDRPWGVTSAFPSWGGKLIDGVGLPIRDWEIFREQTLDASLFGNTTGVMNFGLMLGALAAAGLAGRFAPVWRLSARDVWTAALGGLLMGYGARLAYGCNIGGFVGGVASGSLHGWWWLVFGWIGSWAGVRLRGRIGMDPAPPAQLREGGARA